VGQSQDNSTDYLIQTNKKIARGLFFDFKLKVDAGVTLTKKNNLIFFPSGHFFD